jgi:phosphonate transport system ATP-binding protein
VSAFRLESATVRFGALVAVDAARIAIEPGERVAFVGPSGSGKTTLLRLLNGAVRPAAGRVVVDGEDLGTLAPDRMRAVRARIGFVHQDLSLVPNLRVWQNVSLGRLGRRGFLGALRDMIRPAARDLERIHALLERVGIPEKLYQRTDRLSGGQQQRVAIARALFQDPAALLADEPVSSVDPARARDTVTLLAEISQERNLTLCMSLHNLELARECFPRLVGLRAGRIVFDRPAHDVREDEFAALYRLDRSEMLADGA